MVEENCCCYLVQDNFNKDNLIIFEKAIKKSLYQTSPQEREDLEQELYIKLFVKMKSLNFREDAPSFWGLLKKS